METVLTDAQTARTKRRAQMLWVAGSASLLLAVLVLTVTGWTVYRNWADASRAAEITQSNRDYLRTLNSILNEMNQADSGESGYVLTGREEYLEPYQRVVGPIQANLQMLSKIAQTDSEDKDTIDQLEGLIPEELAELKKTVELRRDGGVPAAMTEILTDKGQRQINRIRALCNVAVDTKRANVVRETNISAQHQMAAIQFSALGGMVLLSLMVAGLLVLNSGARQQTHFAERLADSREIFETTLTSIGDAVMATDTSGRITFINPEAARMTGWRREEAVGQPLEQVFRIMNESSGQDSESPFQKVMRTGSAAGLAKHTVLIRRDGSELPIDDSGAPIRDAYGKVSGVVLVFRDIAERRKAEASLEHSHSEVLKVNEELRQFSYAATHDLQEPLRTIVVFSQLLGRNYKEILDDRGRHLLQTVEEAAVRMSTLIDHLLAYTRVGGLDSSGTRVAVAASEILDDTLVQLKGAIEETKAKITYGDLARVWSEPAQLSQVFQNLISNAIKYRKPDVAPEIRVTSTNDGEFATFQVADNGVGFKQEYSDRVFLLFQRLHGRAIPGTGIGLALCRRIVERQGGRIWVNSEDGKGSTFYFTLPAVQEKVVNSTGL